MNRKEQSEGGGKLLGSTPGRGRYFSWWLEPTQQSIPAFNLESGNTSPTPWALASVFPDSAASRSGLNDKMPEDMLDTGALDTPRRDDVIAAFRKPPGRAHGRREQSASISVC